jgi:hypothetical protein
MSEAESN